MQTDKHLYSIFSGNPEWLFELTGRPSPGPCQFESMSFKALELTADGVVVPETVKEAITIVEFQFQQDSTVYVRTVLEMALVQRKSPDRQVQGMILFLDENLDSRSEPWCQIVQSYSLSNLISKLVLTNPTHPLIAVFHPLLAENENLVEQEAARCYSSINSSELSQQFKSILLDVFVSWVEQRLKDKGKL